MDTAVCSTVARRDQSWPLSCSPCTLQTSPTDHSTVICKSSLDDGAYREVNKDFVDWCQQSHLQLNAGKTKELVVDFSRHRQPCTQVNIQGKHSEIERSYSTWEVT